MSDITWDDKNTGGTFSAAEANEVKAAVNSKIDKELSITGGVDIYQISTDDSETYGGFFSGAYPYTGVNPDGRTNNVLNFVGFNIANNGAPYIVGEPSARSALESHFQQDGQAAFELHLASFYNKSGVERRPLTISYFTDDLGSNYDKAFTSLNQDRLVISDTSNANTFLQINSNGQLAGSGAALFLNGSSTLSIGENNQQTFRQINATDTAFLSLPYIDDTDRLVIPGDAYFPNNVQFNNQTISSVNFSGEITFTGTIISGVDQGARLDNSSFTCQSSHYIGWSSTTHAYDTNDTSISRSAAGVVAIGTGSQGSTAGKVAANNVILSPDSSVTPASNGQMTFELTSDTSLTIKVKGSDGTVRSAVLTLSP